MHDAVELTQMVMFPVLLGKAPAKNWMYAGDAENESAIIIATVNATVFQFTQSTFITPAVVRLSFVPFLFKCYCPATPQSVAVKFSVATLL